MLFSKKKEIELFAPTNGRAISIENVEDDVFSNKLLGEGFAVIPTSGEVYAPVAGEIVMLQDSKHAIGIKVSDKVEILIHIGIDTVNLKGEGFESFVQVGDRIEVGDKLVSFDMDLVEKSGYKNDVIVIVIDNPQLSSVKVHDCTDTIAAKSVLATVI